MAFKSLSPTLWVEDLDESVAFYCEVLGFACPNRSDEWATLVRDDVELMLSLPNEHEPYDGPVFSGTFYFRVDNVDEMWSQLRDQVPVVYPIEDFDYGMREFAIRDFNGYILQFGQPLQ